MELVPSIRLFVIECLDYLEWSIHLLRPQHLRDDHGKVSDLVECRTQLLFAECSRLEDDSCFGRDECQSESRSRSPPTVSDLFEKLLQVPPILLKNIGEDRPGVGMVEYHVDTGRQVLVREFPV